MTKFFKCGAYWDQEDDFIATIISSDKDLLQLISDCVDVKLLKQSGHILMTREEVAIICKAMSDTNRLRIIEMLTQGEKCGCHLLEELQVTQPTLSHHMKVLSDCGLVSSYKDGKWQHYSINCEKFKEYKEYIAAITCCGNNLEENNSKACCK